MKTTLELPDELMRAVKVRAAATDRKLKDVVTEAIALGLAASNEATTPEGTGPSRRGKRTAAKLDPALAALFAAGDAMAAAGVDFEAWSAKSRDVWR